MDKFPLDEVRTRCTELRLRLFANGFDPLPNEGKIPRLKDWPHVEINEELIQSRAWARSNKIRDTGVRCGDVIAIDWDINDKALLNDLLDLVVEQGLIPESRFVRIGKKPREMWIYRTADKVSKKTTGFFARPDAGPDDRPEQVEILGRGCQFAAFGLRDPATPYTWPDLNIADHKFMDLPEVTAEQLDKLKDFVVLFFEERSLIRRSAEGGSEDGYTVVYDLTPDMTFDVHNVGAMTVAEMQSYLESQPEGTELRCRVQVLRPGTSGSLAGQASLSNGVICISDHGSYTSHFPADIGGGAELEELGQLLEKREVAAIFERPEPVRDESTRLLLDPHLPFDDNYGVALQRFHYVTKLGTVADVEQNVFDMPMVNFKNMCAPFYRATINKNGTENVSYLADLWLRDRDRSEVVLGVMRPDMPYPIFEENGERFYNSYRDIVLPTGGDASMGFDVIEKLLPVPAERHYFLQWLAYKMLHPDIRGPGIIMVAHDTYGTGRGSLIQMLTGLFVNGLVREIGFDSLTGRGTQGQYNDWLADCALVAVNEAQDAQGSKWQQRQSAYEHLKEIVDPAKHTVHIKRKGLPNYMGRTSASLLIMTNHADSIGIPRSDRRFAVLENGRPQPQEYWSRFHAWREDKRNLGAFLEQLKKYPLDGYNPFTAPPMTHAKADMVDASNSPLDRAVDHVLANMQGAFLAREQLMLALENYMADYSVEMPHEWQKGAMQIYLRRTRTVAATQDTVRVDGKMRFIRQLKDAPPGALESDASLLQEVMRNGPFTRPMQGASKPVNFG